MNLLFQIEIRIQEIGNFDQTLTIIFTDFPSSTESINHSHSHHFGPCEYPPTKLLSPGGHPTLLVVIQKKGHKKRKTTSTRMNAAANYVVAIVGQGRRRRSKEFAKWPIKLWHSQLCPFRWWQFWLWPFVCQLFTILWTIFSARQKENWNFARQGK